MSSDEFIPIARPDLGTEEERAVCEVLRSGWVSSGPRVMEFESRLAEYLGCRYVRAVNSGSSAILLALKALKIGQGDSVIVPAFTCAATALPVLALGAEPLFVDVDLSTFNMALSDVANAIRPDTKAIILVHIFGRMAAVTEFADYCQKRGIILIEDACLALGAKLNSKSAGTFGAAGCFSFHPRKIITTGEGGAVCTDDPKIAEFVERDRSYGAASSAWKRLQQKEGSPTGFERLAFNFKLTDIQATIGIVQLDKLPMLIEKRRQIATMYMDAMASILSIQVPVLPADKDSFVHQSFVCLWSPYSTEELLTDKSLLRRAESSLRVLRDNISSQGVAVSDSAQCLPELPVFSKGIKNDGLVEEKYPRAYLASKLAFALPIFPQMESSMIDRVISAVRTACKKKLL